MKEKNNVKVITVDENVVKDIQTKDYEAYVISEVITKILQMHKEDEDASILLSPVFVEYQKMAGIKRKEFDMAKNKMKTDYIPKDVINKIKEWSLDYYTNELRVVFK